VVSHGHQRAALCRAFYMVAQVLQGGGHVLVVNTNPGFSALCRHQLGERPPGLSYIHATWVGGLLTNWRQMSRSVSTFARFRERCGAFLHQTRLDFPRYRRVAKCFSGLVSDHGSGVRLAFHHKPDLVFVVNPNENRGAIREAGRLHIPVVALAESNTDLRGIQYPIPGNTASMGFVHYCLKKLLVLAVPLRK
jgi:small subunit ribosomal protein S2